MEAITLLPCPFCGGEATVDSDWPSAHCVECEQCSAAGPFDETKEQAITAWNTRTPDIQVSDLVSALKATTHEVEAMIPCVYHDITRDSMQAVADNARAALASFQEDDNG